MKRESFVFYLSHYEAIKDLSDEQIGRIFRAIFEEQLKTTSKQPQNNVVLTGAEKIAFNFINNQMVVDNEKYLKKCERLKNNAKKGGAPKGNQNAKKQKQPKQPNREKNNLNDNDNDNDYDNNHNIIDNNKLLSCEVNNSELSEENVKTEIYKEIVSYMNTVNEHQSFNVKQIFSYRYNSKDTKSHINARLREGYTIDDFKDVIWWGYRKFVEFEFKTQNGESSVKYFRPSTLFSEKHFEEYLNEYRANTK